ncbi:MAG: hypothetical protein K8S56_02385, partial [Candidatus Cloacimonetes bacterium]|nr:hypothetical protein [Candidatus Cloacimonadota bacterium]
MERMNIKVTADTHSAQGGFKALSNTINETAASLSVTIGRLNETKDILKKISNSRFKLTPDVVGNITNEASEVSALDNMRSQIQAMQEMHEARKLLDTDLDAYRRELDEQYLDWKTENWIAQHETEYELARNTMQAVEGFY